MKQPLFREWVNELPWKMQTVMVQGLRAPDTHFCKNMKDICRWMRSLVFHNADKNHTFMCEKNKRLPQWSDIENEINYCSLHCATHFIYALEIIAYKYPLEKGRSNLAMYLYEGLVHHMCHFAIETEDELDVRLSDVEERPELCIAICRPEPEPEPKTCPSGRADNYSWRP